MIKKPLQNVQSEYTDFQYCFKVPPDNQFFEKYKSHIDNKTKEKESDDKKYVLCSQCLQHITSIAEKITIHGNHYHTFANPQGIIFSLGCFRSAPGCGYTGSSTYEWSWFSGYRWRIALCSKCLTHLGWLFESHNGERFNGLILDRILQPE